MEEFIPRNVEDTGGVFNGMFKTRNVIEAFIGTGTIYVLFHFILVFIPSTLRIILGLTLGAMCAIFFIVGANGQPVSVAVLDSINFRRTRCVVVLRKPRPDRRQTSVKRKRRIKMKLKKRGEKK